MSGTVEASRIDRRVDELVSEQAARTPQATAAVFGERALTYAELERAAARMAARLRAAGIGRGALAGIHLERGLEMLVAVLGVMKAGGAYVPLDPEFPPARLAHMVGDSGLRVVVTQASLASSAPAGDYTRLEVDGCLDESGPMPAPAGGAQPAAGADLVYVLYTSGSTGLPKGVALEHRNVVNFLLSMRQEPGLAAHDRLLAVTTLSFDIAGLELYLPLTCGATVVIAGSEQAADGAALRELIERHAVTAMQATPTTWRLLLEAGWPGRAGFKALCGGEALPRDLAQALTQRCGELWNMYGPTETAIWSTIFRVRDGAAPILIGRPIANTSVYILDKSGRPVPTGVPGEIHIGGAGVARGYVNRPELTAERFVPDPFRKDFGARMYRTGDTGRYLPDGNLEFRNRVDNQVKIRGFRVELGEVEAAMSSHPAVRQAVARVVELRPGDARLVGYLVADGPAPGATELREHLRGRLPHYMVPQHLIVLDAMPLTPNGKVDRAQLPAPQSAELLAEAHVEPRTPTEEAVVAAFREVLDVDRVSADASFFDLGGHSILATRVVSRLRARGHEAITLRMLFEAPTATALARAIDEPRAAAGAEREAFQF